MSEYQNVTGGVQAAPSAALGEDASLGRMLLPTGGRTPWFYPCTTTVLAIEGSARKGTPGVTLSLYVTKGPCAGREVQVREWLTPGSAEARGKGRSIGRLHHMAHVLSGRAVEMETVMAKYGCTFDRATISDFAKNAEVIWAHFNSMDAATQLEWAKEYFRVEQWNGREAIYAITTDEDQTRSADGKLQWIGEDGERTTEVELAQVDDEGKPVPNIFTSNRIRNVYALDDDKYSLAAISKTNFPLQEKAVADGF